MKERVPLQPPLIVENESLFSFFADDSFLSQPAHQFLLFLLLIPAEHDLVGEKIVVGEYFDEI